MSPSPPSSTRTDTLFPDTTLFRTDRSYFLDELRHLGITRATDPGPISAAVLYLDLDDFKPVNDAHGHLVGDHVLEEVARRLRQCVRPSDVVARLGGDEFAILCRGLDGVDARSDERRVGKECGSTVRYRGGTD